MVQEMFFPTTTYADGIFGANFVAETCAGGECTDALSINACGGTYTGTTTGETPSGEAACVTAAGTGGALWYHLTGDGRTWTAETVTGSNYDTKIWVYSGTCGSLTCVTGNDDGGAGTLSLVNFATTGGQDYYIVVGGFNASEGDYVLNVSPTLSTSTNSLSACGSATINGNTYTTSQTVTDTLAGAAASGCDSIAITNLTIGACVSGGSLTSNPTCPRETFGVNYTASGTFTAGNEFLVEYDVDSTFSNPIILNGIVSTTSGTITCATPGNLGAGTYVVRVTSTNPGSSYIVGTFTLSGPLPDLAYTINGATEVCVGSTEGYTTGAVNNATSYTWTNPTNSTITSGQGTDNVNINFNASYTTGQIYVTPTNSCGSSNLPIFQAEVTSPYSAMYNVGGTYLFGGEITTPLSAPIVYAMDNSSSYEGCDAYPAGTFSGSIALIDRGSCYFSQKIYNAQQAGAVGVIIANNDTSSVFNMSEGHYGQQITIPSAFMLQADADAIKAQLGSGVNVTLHPFMHTVNGSNSVNSTEDITACGSATINGTTYTTSQTVVDVFTGAAANGCDSTHTTNLTIGNAVNTSENLTACGSATINGTTYTTSQTVVDVFTGGSMYGCDSTHTTNLTINNAPSNQDCANAIALSPGIIMGTTICASNDNMPTCGTTNGTLGGVWYTYTSNGGAINANTCGAGTNFDTKIRVYEGTCGSLTCVAGNDDACTANRTIVNWCGTAGTTYYILVHGWSNSEGDFELSLSETAAPVSSETLIACGSATINGNTYTTSQTVVDVLTGAAQGGCDSTHTTYLTIGNDMNTSENMTACGSVTINGNTYTTSQTVVDVFTGGTQYGCDSTHTTNLTISTFALANIPVVGCGSAVVNGTTYTSSTTISDTIVGGSVNGCDSITVHTITINNAVTSSENLTACGSATINGNTYTTSQAVVDVFAGGAANGCDSTHTTNLTINNAVNSTEDMVACGSATINGTTYTMSQTVVDVFTGGAANGCDSTHTTNLTIGNPVSSSENMVACGSVTINGNVYSSSQTVVDVLAGASQYGCDSTHTTNLTISTYAQTNIPVVGCGSAIVNGTTYTSSTTISDTIIGGSINGCDSITVHIITINQPVSSVENMTACGSMIINGNTYTTSQTVVDVFTGGAANGCDSTHTTNLTIVNEANSSETMVACGSATINGTTYTMSQTVVDVFSGAGANGCDSIHTTYLTIGTPVNTTEDIIACGTVTINGNTYSTSQAVVDVFTGGSQYGCDSTHTTNLTISTYAQVTIPVVGCGSVDINGTTYTTSQVIADTIINGSINGCDSITVHDITINQPVSSSETLMACDSAVINGTTYTTSQTVVDVITGGAANGCDSTHTTILTINSASSTSSMTACGTVTINGNSYSTSQTIVDVLPGASQYGCDSTHTTILTISNYALANIDQQGCDSAMVFGTMYYTDQMIYDTIIGGSINGCDSITAVNLTIGTAVTTQVTYSTCDASYFVGGAMQTTNGVYTDTYTGMGGCDSIVETTLTLNASGTSYFFDEEICQGESIVLGGASQTTAGVYYDTIAVTGCDSIIVTTLTVNPSSTTTIDTTVQPGGSIVVAGTTYNTSGSYSDVQVGANGCDSTIIYNLTVLPDGIEGLSASTIGVYPNPTKGTIYLKDADNNIANINVVDIQGRSLLSIDNYKNNGNGIDISSLADGVYFVKINTITGEHSTIRVVKMK